MDIRASPCAAKQSCTKHAYQLIGTSAQLCTTFEWNILLTRFFQTSATKRRESINLVRRIV